jgi:glutathione S-transferase
LRFHLAKGGGFEQAARSIEGKPMHHVLHEYSQSGNCYKIRLTAALLGVELERREYDILNGETRTPEFLAAVNPNGRIPVLQVGERFIPESNAACFYLADSSPLVPDDRFDRADMLRWMFFEQYNHEPNVATLRFWLAFVGEERLSDAQRALLPGKRAGGDAALALMEDHLAARSFFVGDRPTLADIALYAYTHVAEEGGFDLAALPAVSRWLDRVAAMRGYLPMDA